MLFVLSIIFFVLGIFEYRKYLKNYAGPAPSKIRTLMSYFLLGILFLLIAIFGLKD